MYFETVIRGYHAHKEDHKLTLGEICILESDAAALTYDKFALKFVTADGKTVGHLAKHLSKICFKFMEDGGEMDGEIVGKRFNAGTGMGIEVPVEMRFIGNKQYLEKLSVKIKLTEQENLSATETGTAGTGRCTAGQSHHGKGKTKRNLIRPTQKASSAKKSFLSEIEIFNPKS